VRLQDVKAASLPIRPGELIGGRYRIEKVLGQGGMAVVVSAKDERLDEVVAIKVLLPERVANSDARERFTREARTAVRIKNEHVVRVTDVGELPDGTPYMVMEYLEGEDLASLLVRKKKVPASTAMFYVLQVCSALKEAHGLGVVHRDLKPANLFLAKKRGQPPSLKVLDFGISKVETHDRRRTETKEILGSPWYMAPEQMKRAASADSRADVWSLGIILHELVTGEVPFDGASMTEVIVTVLHDDPRIAASPDIPESLGKVIRKCLSKSPDDRYATADDLAAALREADVPLTPPSSESILKAAVVDEDDGEMVDESDLIPSANPPMAAPSTPPPRVSTPPPVPSRTPPPAATGTAAAAVAAASAAIKAQEESEAKLAAEVEMLPSDPPPPASEEDNTTGIVPVAPAERQRTTTRPRKPRVDPPAIAAPAPMPPRKWGTYLAILGGVGLLAYVATRRDEPVQTSAPAPTVKESPPEAPAPTASLSVASAIASAPPAVPEPAPAPVSVPASASAATTASVASKPAPPVSAAPVSARPKPQEHALVSTPMPAPAPAPSPVAGPATEEDDATVASAEARKHYTALRQACWDSSDKTTFIVNVAAAVDPNGSVTSARGSASDPTLAECVASQVRTWSFPPSKKGRLLQIPVRFRR
jgi:serine/threonine-protein kinase